MPHLVLLGDSILDNGRYTGGGPSVLDHMRRLLPDEWAVSLRAVDGSTTFDIPAQLRALPPDATHLALSVGGNDAMLRFDVLDAPVTSSAAAFLMLADAAKEFEAAYRMALKECLARCLPLVVCTVYNGNFPEESQRRRAAVAIAVYDDIIIRAAAEHRLTIVELRSLCTGPADYANPIEPSVQGGGKIAWALVQAVTGCDGPAVCGRLQVG